MAKKDYASGTFLHGIAASEHLDSSGERIKIEGVDISSLTKDGVFNFEHQSKEASAIVGKILEAKKILKRSDCENDDHRYFWDKIKMPYVYVAGELFDAEGHAASQDVAAMLKYDNKSDKRKTKRLINFSIEGSRLDKSGANILKCIARKVSITITPCNKVCEAEEKAPAETKKSLLQDVLGKSEESYCELMKAGGKKYYTSLYQPKDKVSSKQAYKPQSKVSSTATTGGGIKENKPGKPIKPKRTFKPSETPEKMKPGDRISYRDKPKMRTGHDIYNDPDTWKGEPVMKKKKMQVDPKDMADEHEKLVDVLESPSHEDDKKEAKKQKKELKEYKRKAKKKEKNVEDIKIDLKKKKKKIKKGGLGDAITSGIIGSGSTPQGGVNTAIGGITAPTAPTPPTPPAPVSKARRNLNEGKKIRQPKRIKPRNKVARGKKVQTGKRLDPRFYDSNVKKALVASSAMAAPSVTEGTQALSGKDMKVKMQEVCKSISDENWKTFTKSEQLISFLEQRLPNLDEKRIIALAKTVAYLHEKKKEVKLKDLIDV